MECKLSDLAARAERACSEEAQRALLVECGRCATAMDAVVGVGSLHYVRVALLKVRERLQSQLGDLAGCHASNAHILHFYRKTLPPHSPWLGLQYALTAKLLKHVIHDEWHRLKLSRFEAHARRGESESEREALFLLCVKARTWFDKALQILRVSHGEVPLLTDLARSKLVLQNLESFLKL